MQRGLANLMQQCNLMTALRGAIKSHMDTNQSLETMNFTGEPDKCRGDGRLKLKLGGVHKIVCVKGQNKIQ
jgi:hypothetical protein